MTRRGASPRTGDLVTIVRPVDKVFLRRSSSLIPGEGGYGRSGTLKQGTVAIVVKVEDDGDCYLISSRSHGWLMRESLEVINERRDM